MAPDLGNPAGPFHVEPEPLVFPDDPAARSLPVNVFCDVADLLPLATVVEAVDEHSCVLLCAGEDLVGMACYLAMLDMDLWVEEPAELREEMARVGARLARTGRARGGPVRERGGPAV